jgi:hypothetical protein
MIYCLILLPFFPRYLTNSNIWLVVICYVETHNDDPIELPNLILWISFEYILSNFHDITMLYFQACNKTEP